MIHWIVKVIRNLEMGITLQNKRNQRYQMKHIHLPHVTTWSCYITKLELHFNRKLDCTWDMNHFPYYDWLPVPKQVNESKKCVYRYFFFIIFPCIGNCQITLTAIGSLITSNISLHLITKHLTYFSIKFFRNKLTLKKRI